MANKFFEKVVNKTTPMTLEKLTPVAGCRHAAGREAKERLFFGEGAGRNTARELHLKRQTDVTMAYQKLHGFLPS